MTANNQAQAAADTAAPSFSTLAGQSGNTPLTRVALAFVDQRINLYLRFGNPARTIHGPSTGGRRGTRAQIQGWKVQSSAPAR